MNRDQIPDLHQKIDVVSTEVANVNLGYSDVDVKVESEWNREILNFFNTQFF